MPRSYAEICALILGAAVNGATRTEIMAQSFLTYSHVREYLKALQTNDLIVCYNGDNVYKTTSKGHRFLKIYNQLDRFVSPVAEYYESLHRNDLNPS